MKQLRRFSGYLLVLLGMSAHDTEALEVTILDEDHRPTAARVRFTGMDSVYYAPQGHASDFAITSPRDPEGAESDIVLDDDRRFAYVDGSFSIELPAAPVRVEVIKGYRYRIHDETVDLSQRSAPLEITLRMAFDLPDAGWYSGDVHVHFLDPESAMLELKGEDLNVCNVLISDFTVDHHRFRGKIEPGSDSKHLLFYGQEYRENRLGHVDLLNLRERLIEPAKEMRKHQYPLNLDASEKIRKQGGHISWAHFAAWPGLEGPLGIVLKKVDAVELLCTMDPFHAPIFAPDVVPEVQMNSGLRLWYRLLNCGLRMPATAGTDKMNNQVTVGANRVFARVDGAFTYDNWIDALTQGRTFVSNSPFLSFRVDEQDPGGEISGASGQTYRLHAEVWCQLPIDRLEIVANGELVAETSIARGETHATLSVPYRTSESVWIAARAYQFSLPDTRRGLSMSQRRDAGGGPTELNRYFGTLRPETTFAHTSPVYLTIDGQPIRSKVDADYFVHYLENAMRWLDESGSFPSDGARAEVLTTFEKGRRAFEDLAR